MTNEPRVAVVSLLYAAKALVSNKVALASIDEAIKEIERLRNEVAQLNETIAKAHGVWPETCA